MFSQGNCTETARIRPTKLPPRRSSTIPDRPGANSRVYLQNPLFNLSSKPSFTLFPTAIRYFSISPLQRFPPFVRRQLDYRDFTRFPGIVFSNSFREELFRGLIHA